MYLKQQSNSTQFAEELGYQFVHHCNVAYFKKNCQKKEGIS